MYLKYFDDMVAEEAERNANGIIVSHNNNSNESKQRLSIGGGGKDSQGNNTPGGVNSGSLGLLGGDY